MRDKLIELIGDAPYGLRTLGQAADELISVESIADHLIAHGVTVQWWISVSERLPDDSGNVILCTRSKIVGAGFYDKNTKNWVQHYSGGGICVEATHWMPLPEPPKEGE